MSSRLGELLELYCDGQERLNDAEVEFGRQIRIEDAGRVLKPRWSSGSAQRRAAEAFVNVADALVSCRACRDALLQSCAEEGVDWHGVCEANPDVALAERQSRGFLDVGAGEELWNLLCERMAGEAGG